MARVIRYQFALSLGYQFRCQTTAQNTTITSSRALPNSFRKQNPDKARCDERNTSSRQIETSTETALLDYPNCCPDSCRQLQCPRTFKEHIKLIAGLGPWGPVTLLSSIFWHDSLHSWFSDPGSWGNLWGALGFDLCFHQPSEPQAAFLVGRYLGWLRSA